MIGNENHIVVHGWMRNELKLKGNELMLYSLIYGFSQDRRSKFYGSLDYASDWIGCSKATTCRALEKLQKKELIIKEEVYQGRALRTSYYANPKFIYKDSLKMKRSQNETVSKGERDSLKMKIDGFKMRHNNKRYSTNNIYSKVHNFQERAYDYDSLEEMYIDKINRSVSTDQSTDTSKKNNV